jgi:ribonuclease BN (tRNA processing enzyme)
VAVLRLTILGNQGPYPGPGGACSGYLVRSQDASVLVDCGPGVMSKLEEQIDLPSLDAIVISHYHPDHYSDFLTMRYAFHYIDSSGGMNRPVTLALPLVGMEWFLQEIVATGYRHLFEIVPIEHGTRLRAGGRDSGLIMDFRQMSHAIPSFGGIVYAGKPVDGARAPLAYTSDTGPCESLDGMAGSAYALLAEASLLDGDLRNKVPGHLSAAEVGRVAAEHGVGRLLLTHLHPANLLEESVREASEAYGGEVEVAAMGKTYALNAPPSEEMEDEHEI